jgi:hypothetical protein
MRERGYRIGNLDCTLIAEKPKLSPHKADIRCVLEKPQHWRVEKGRNASEVCTHPMSCLVILCIIAGLVFLALWGCEGGL